ncbi:DUF6603 domain-containing protein [Halostreptopolyspora alba]
MVEFSFVQEVVNAAAHVIKVTEKKPLSITGTIADTFSATVTFIPEQADPEDGTPIIGISLTISLTKDHAGWGIFADIGLDPPTVKFLAASYAEGTWKRLAVETVINTTPAILVSCEIPLKRKPTSYRFILTRAGGEPFSLIEAFEKLGVDGIDEFGPLLPQVGRLWLDYTPRQSAAPIVISGDSTDHRTGAPRSFTFGLAVLAKDKNKRRPLVLMASFPLGTVARLSQLSMLRGQIPKDVDLALDAVNVVAATADVPKATLTEVNRVLTTSGAPTLPTTQDLGKGVQVNLDITIVKDKRTLIVLGKKQGTDTPYAVEPDEVQPLALDSTPQPKDSSTTEVQRALGPLHINRVGARLAPPHDGSGATRVLLEIDAALIAAGFELRATGLAIGLTITKDPRVTVDLAGLGAGFSQKPITVTGAIVKRDRVGYDYAYEGLLMVQATKWGLLAVGSYARIKDVANRPGYTSLFVFGGLAGKIAGPPPVVFTGLALGIGYNSKIRLPDADGVPEFPFIKALADMKGFAGDPPDPVSTLEKITGGTGDDPAVVVPEPGNLWFTAGLAATIAETIAVQALLIAQFGPDDFSVALLGAMNADFPPRDKALSAGEAESAAPDDEIAPTADAQPRVAHVELGFRALYEHKKRQLSLTAALSDNSWIVHPDCKLTGGAAIYVWFPGSSHSGDFVGTVGGYHPNYHPPAHYPQQVQRLGIHWSVSSAVSVRGELYVAVTPKVGMVGGRLSVDFRSGGLHAWLNAGFDAIVWWAPLYFDLRMWISIGASYTATVLWWDVTIRAEIGAYLSMWGPPTGGTARVEVGPFSKSIDFGEPKALRIEPLSWAEFRNKQLPADPLGISPLDGLLTDPVKSRETTNGRWVVSTDGFSFSTRSALPTTTLICNGVDNTPENQPTLKVGPMNDAVVTVKHEVTVTSGGFTVSGWIAEAVTGRYPRALWAAAGTTTAPPGRDEVQTIGYASGAVITAPPPKTDGRQLAADGKAVQYAGLSEPANPLSLITPEHNEDATSPEPNKDKARAALKNTLKRLNLLVEPV